MCIDIVELWFRIANGIILAIFWQFLTELSAQDTYIFLFQDNNLSKS